MTAPNIVSVATITGKTGGTSLSTTNVTQILSNAPSSSQLIKINVLNVANTTGNACPVTVSYYSLAGVGGTQYPIVSSVSVPANSTLTVIDKGTNYYLEENQSIGAQASQASALVVTYSYEIIS